LPDIRKDSVIPDKLAVGNGLSYWFAKDIHYIVPEPYRNRDDLFTDERGNCIWLQMKLNINYDTASNGKSSKSDLTVFCTATSIVPGNVSENNFSIPPSYTKGTSVIPDREIEIKSVVVEKEEIEPPPPPPPPRPVKPKPIKKKQ
jgi:hypothetical protein